MRKTTTLPIFGKKVKVKHIELSHLSAIGMYNPIERTIYIQKGISKDAYHRTLCHEIGHAFIDILGLHNAALSIDLEEILVENFSAILNDLFEIKLK